MPDHDRLQRTAHVQWGYFTSQQAADHGFSRQLCNHHCRRGSWTRVARGIFRMHGVPERPDEDLAFITLLASDARGRPVGVVSHDSALHVHGLLRRRPATVHLSLPPGIHMSLPSHVTAYRRRIDLPWSVAGQPPGAAPRYAEPFDVGAYREGLRAASPRRPGRWNVWAEPWRPRAAASGSEGLHEWRRPPLVAEEIEDRGAFRLTAPLRSVLDCLSWGTAADLTEALQRGLARGAFGLDDVLAALDGLPLFPASRGHLAALSAVRDRAVTVEREVIAMDLRWRSHRHHLAKTVLLPDEGDTPVHLFPSPEQDDPWLPLGLAHAAELAAGRALSALGGDAAPDADGAESDGAESHGDGDQDGDENSDENGDAVGGRAGSG